VATRTTEARLPDVAIVGGGIVGASAAAFLSAAGARVRLYERSAIAAGASGRNSGVVQQPFDAILAGLYGASLEAYRELAAEDPEFALPDEPAGLLYVSHDLELAREAAAAWSGTWPASRPEVLAGAELRHLEPALASDLVACRLAIGFPVAPASATHAFARLADRRGTVTDRAEARPAVEGGRVVGVSVDRRIEPAGAVLVAAGPWTPELVDPSGSWRPIMPIWGVVASLALDAPPRHVLESADIVIEPDSKETSGARSHAEPDSAEPRPAEPSDRGVDFSLVPAAGSSALGSTFLRSEPDPETWLPALRRVGARYVPEVASAPRIGLRHCARPVSLDGRPLVGNVDGIEGLFVAAGHGPWGISTGPGTARLVSELILGRIAQADLPDALAPDRFGRLSARIPGR
jgi:glycine/D-amino acid oxidase-like deaminating enzyme